MRFFFRFVAAERPDLSEIGAVQNVGRFVRFEAAIHLFQIIAVF